MKKYYKPLGVQQSVNLTIQYTITHISPRLTPHSPSLLSYTILIPHHLHSLPFTAIIWSAPYFKLPSLHLISLFFSYHIPTPVLESNLISPYFNFPSLHLTSLSTFLNFSLNITDFPAIQIPINSIITFQSLTSLHPIPFNSLQFSYHFYNLLLPKQRRRNKFRVI